MAKFKIIKHAHKCRTPLEAVELSGTIERIKLAAIALNDIDPKLIAETSEQGHKILFMVLENLRLARRSAVERLRREFLAVQK
jgi:hypothetical protein